MHKQLPLDKLVINRANDRHGELENETAAMAWLFNNREQHMRNLAKDIAETGQIYELPLVCPQGDEFVVFDGNRRVTCLKLLKNPRRAPTIELQEFFSSLSGGLETGAQDTLECQVEPSRDRIDDILYRRHTGTQGGVGQSTWDDRMKANFVNRTGKGSGSNVAEQIENFLADAERLPRNRIPRSNLNRLLSAEAFRNRVGITLRGGRVEFTHREPAVLHALHRVAEDLADRRIVLDDIWDVDSKRAYLDSLDAEGVLPSAEQSLAKPKPNPRPRPKPATPPQPTRRIHLIPNVEYAIAWAGRLQRHRAIWEELQYRLQLAQHPNAISVLFRVLLELAIDNYMSNVKLASVVPRDSLAKRTLAVADDLHRDGKIKARYLEVFRKFSQYDALVSADTLHRYVHSPNFAPSPEHLTALWDTLSEFIVLCLNVAVPVSPDVERAGSNEGR